MPELDSANSHFDQLELLSRIKPVHRPRVVFVPKLQIGQAVGNALAARGISWVNLRMTTIQQHAAMRAAGVLHEKRWRRLPAGGDVLVLDALLREVPGGYFGKDPAPGVARSLAATIGELRLAGIDAGEYKNAAASDRARAVADLYGRYVHYLREHQIADEAQIFEFALDAPIHPDDAGGIFAIFDEVQLTELARRYLARLADQAEACYRISHLGTSLPPIQVAAHRLAADKQWKKLCQVSGRLPEELYFAESVGVENEVRAVLRNIMERGLPLDTVEVAYITHDPYLSLLRSILLRQNIEATFAAGTPIKTTRTGQALRGFFSWIEEGFDAKILVRLLRGNLLRIGRVISGARMTAHKLAALLEEAGTGQGRDAYGSSLEALAERSRVSRHARISAAREVLDHLLALVPEEQNVSLQKLAASGLAFLRLFGPVTMKPSKLQSDYGPEEHTFVILMRRLTFLSESVDLQGPLPRMALRLREMIDRMFAGARKPQPGKVHVVPLSSAGYSGRPHLFVLGMDESSFASPLSEDPLLLDEERRLLNSRSGREEEGVLPLKRMMVGMSAYHLERTLTSARQSATLITNRLDLENDRELFPSAAYLQLRSSCEAVDPQQHTFVPGLDLSQSQASTLDDIEMWLAVREDTSDQTEEDLRMNYPAVWAGRRAVEERKKDVYTSFDGWLGEQHAGESELDPLGEKVSPSRLETLSTCPYKYFLHYVLEIQPPKEISDDETICIDRLEEGALLHGVFEQFMREITAKGERPEEKHRDRLHVIVEELLTQAHGARVAARPAAARALRDRLHRTVDIFLNAEIEHCRTHVPLFFEYAFGYDPGDRAGQGGDGADGDFELSLNNGLTFRLRGRIDRIDRRPDGTLVIWDYKTGSLYRYKEMKDLLNEGKNLQWALYSYALEQLLPGEKVSEAGYFFPGVVGFGQRLSARPDDYRVKVAEIVEDMVSTARSGFFPPRPNGDECKYCNFIRVCSPVEARRAEIKNKGDKEGSTSA